MSLTHFIHSMGEQWSTGVLWPSRIRYATDSWLLLFTGWDLDWFERWVGPSLVTLIPPVKVGYVPCGRLQQPYGVKGKKETRICYR